MRTGRGAHGPARSPRASRTELRERLARRGARTFLLGAALALVAAACRDSVAPSWSTTAPFAGERYDLASIDGQALPTTVVIELDTFVVSSGSLEFSSSDTVTWQLPDMAPRAAGGAPTTLIASDEYRQPGRDSIEVGGWAVGAFAVSPWAYGRRRAESLTVHTADPVASNPRAQPGFTVLGVHAWGFARRR